MVQLVKDNTVEVSYTYDAFGNLTSTIGTSDNPFLYCGEYYDAESQTYYLRARYYDPANGRFNTEDTHWNATNHIYGDNPIKINEHEDAFGLNRYTLVIDCTAVLQSGNLYAYCMGNPLMFKDSEGTLALLTAMALGATVGALVSGGFQVAANLISGKKWSDGLGKAVLSGAVSGAISTIPIPGVGALGSAIISGAVGTFAGRAIVGDIKTIDDVINSLTTGAVTGAIGYGAAKALSGMLQNYFASLSKAGQKNFLSRITNISNRELTAIRKTIAAGGKSAQVEELIKKYGYDVVVAVFVSAASTEIAT